MKAFLYTAILLLGSSAPAGPATNQSGPATDQASPAVYWVPTDASLQQYAVFQTEATLTVDDDHTTLKYSLPLALTGAENVIELQGPAAVAGQPLVLKNLGTTMTCPNVNLTNCKVSYYDLKFDEAARNKFLAQISSSPQELSARQLVAASFQGGEPHGFFLILSSPKSK